MSEKIREQLNILGVNVDPVNMEEAIEILEGFVKEKTPHSVVTLGTEMTIMCRKDTELKEIINKAHLVVPDTAGIVWATKILYSRNITKVAGIEVMEKIIKKGARENYTFYLLGAKEGIVEKTAENLKKKYPNLQILGTHHGYFKGKEDEVIQEINSLKPDILLLALGVPFQEKWAYKNLDKLNISVCIGLGGSFDVISGKINRAPKFMINLNLEWLYRLYMEPSRFWRMMALPEFMLLIFIEKFKRMLNIKK